MEKGKMKAMVATAYGDHTVLQLQEMDKPKPKPEEILVKVITSAATRADTMMVTGEPYFARLVLGFQRPKKQIIGTGFAGIVESIGSGVSTFKVGDRVFGMSGFEFSANAEYMAISENAVVLPMPENLNFNEAANFGDGHLTSYNFLSQIANVQRGQKVLIIGASGALGTSAVQIANFLGADVTGVCSDKNSGLVRSLGAKHIINYDKEDYTNGNYSFDVIYDTVGKSTFKKCKSILKSNGLYLSPVLTFSLLVEMIITSIFGGKKAKFEATGANSIKKLRELLVSVTQISKQGKLKMIIDRQYPLEKLAEAHKYIASGRKKGNVVMQHV